MWTISEKIITLKFIIFIFFFIENSQNQSNIGNKITNLSHSDNMIHFIRCGQADSILIESNGKYGLIDSSNPYNGPIAEVEAAQIDESIGEKDWSKGAEESVKVVIDYLEYLKIDKLDFIIGTHSHSDHIGGIPAIAYKFVDNNTKYYYRTYRETLEDRCKVDWANFKYYLAAVHSMQKKRAELIDVTNESIEFDFGDLHLKLLNTDIDPNELNLGENQNSIVTLVTFNDTKVFLASDMIVKDDKAILKKDLKDIKLDILKISHHGISESSPEFLKTTSPDYVIITNNAVPNSTLTNEILKINNNTKIYVTGNAMGNTEKGEPPAIKLHFFKGEKNYNFSDNIGKEIKYNCSDKYSWNASYHDFVECINKSDIIFIVSELYTSYLPCNTLTSEYYFNIKGKFSEEVNILDDINIQINTSTGNIIKASCTPFNKIFSFSSAYLQCAIDICMYTLEEIDLYLPIDAPNIKGYSIRNWKNIIGINPNESNKISNVTCLPIIENTFIPSSLEANMCFGKNFIFSIYGEWEDKDESKIPIFLSFSLVIENNERIAECSYETSPNHIECEIDSEGDITIKEQNFSGILGSYKMKKLDSFIKTEKCNYNNNSSNSSNNSKISYLLFIFLFILILN